MADSSTVGQRIAQFIQQLGISKNAFAISLDKTATVIQHLVEERNKPGFDLLCKIFEVYPNVSKDWLLQGVGPMLSDATGTQPSEREQQPLPVAAATSAPVNASAIVESSAPVVNTAALNAATSLEQQTSSSVAPLVASAPPAPEAAAVPLPSPQPAAEVSALAPAVASAPTAPDTSWQTALYTQQMAHQLALAELRNQHLQEQQRLMQQMMDLMQRQLTR